MDGSREIASRKPVFNPASAESLFLDLALLYGIREEVRELLSVAECSIDPDITMGQRLRQARESQGMTLRQTHARSGISKSQLFFYEEGRQRNPGLRTIQALSYGYRIPFGELLVICLQDIDRDRQAE